MTYNHLRHLLLHDQKEYDQDHGLNLRSLTDHHLDQDNLKLILLFEQLQLSELFLFYSDHFLYLQKPAFYALVF